MDQLYTRKNTKGEDVYYCDFLVNGSRVRRSLGTSNYQVAKTRAKELEVSTHVAAKQAKEVAGSSPTETLGDSIENFLNKYPNLKPDGQVNHTKQSYIGQANHLMRLLGVSTPIDSLTAKQIVRYQAYRMSDDDPEYKKAHPHTVHKEMFVLGAALRYSRKRGLCHINIDDLIEKIKGYYTPRERWLSIKELNLLCKNLIDPDTRHKPENQQLYKDRLLFISIMVFAGPRRGEIFKLTWPDINFESNKIRIPKGKTVPRIVPMTRQLAQLLSAARLSAGGEKAKGRVVKRWISVTRDLERACKWAGIEKVSCNDLRRTFASLLINAGVGLKPIAQMMGHKSTKMVESVYARLADVTLDAAIDKMPQADFPVFIDISSINKQNSLPDKTTHT